MKQGKQSRELKGLTQVTQLQAKKHLEPITGDRIKEYR